jgi:hypothetical protein
MSAASKQATMERFERARDLLLKENKQAYDSISKDNVSKMEKIFKTGGIKQGAIDCLIFYVRSVKMMLLFLRYDGDMHKLGPSFAPRPISMLVNYTANLPNYAADSSERRELVKLIKFLILQGADVNAVDELGSSSFWNCARSSETGLCKFLVERGADPSIKRNDGGNALHAATAASRSGLVDVFRYLVEECVLDIDAEYLDENMNRRTPLFLAALKGQIDVCTYLLGKGARVDGGRQPLIAAAQVYIFIRSFFRMATRMFFCFSWIMEQILYCRIEMESAPFSCAVKKAV